MLFRGHLSRSLLLCALLASLVGGARDVDAQQVGLEVLPEQAADPAACEDPPFAEDGSWWPRWTAPQFDQYEQLWRPGDLVDDTYFLRRPWSFGFFAGPMDGGRLTDGVDQSSETFGGFRFGNDFAPRWGWEARSAFYSPDLAYSDSPAQAFAQNWFLDMNVLHYPWGDTRIRPFWSIGLGAAHLKFADEDGRSIRDWMPDLPLAIGCKYQWRPWLSVRGEFTDTIVFGNENFDTHRSLSFSLGAEVHWHSFKTRPVKYGY
jgi:hypothetical protein